MGIISTKISRHLQDLYKRFIGKNWINAVDEEYTLVMEIEEAIQYLMQKYSVLETIKIDSNEKCENEYEKVEKSVNNQYGRHYKRNDQRASCVWENQSYLSIQ